MNNFDWQSFLKEESKKAIAKYQEEKRNESNASWMDFIVLSPEAIESEWLGFPGASEAQILAAETCLYVKLSPSYQNFLKVTNGWNDLYQGIPILRSVDKIDWFCVENQDVIDEYNKPQPYSSIISDEEYLVYDFSFSFPLDLEQPLRTKYMQTALQISDSDDSHFVLLNPKIIHNGEWEAWVFMAGDGDVKRYRSLKEMIQTLGMVDSWV